MDIYSVSKLLGHTDIRNTEIYAKIVDEKKQKEIQKLPVL
jgi:site-specific recombinase XerD